MAAESIGHPSADELRPQVAPEHGGQHESLRGGVVTELVRERDYRDRDADAIDVAKRGAEKEQRDDRVTLRPSRGAGCSFARSCGLAHDAVELRLRGASLTRPRISTREETRRDAGGNAPASRLDQLRMPPLFADSVANGIQNVDEIASGTHVAEQC